MPATAIIGYPPGTMGPEETGAQTAELYAAGWRRFKAPTGGASERSAGTPARRPGCGARMPGWAWTPPGSTRTSTLPPTFIDVHPGRGPGLVRGRLPARRCRQTARACGTRIDVPIAQGDEQGGSYYPEALILAEAVDVIRVDLTCMGGITAVGAIIDEALEAGLTFAPHMFPHVHARSCRPGASRTCPSSGASPGTGVHPMDDPLPGPRSTDGGLMAPLPEEPGFGPLVDAGLDPRPAAR